MAKKNKKKNIPRKKIEEQKEHKTQEKLKTHAPDRLPETADQEGKKKQSEGQNPRNSKAAILLVLIGLAVLIFIGYFLFTKLLRPQSLAELLPEEKTIGLVEFTFDQTQWKDLEEALKPYPAYDLPKARAFFEQLSSLNYGSDIEPWLGRRAGIALFLGHSSDVEASSPGYLLMAESNDHQKTVTALGVPANPIEYQKFFIYESPKLKSWFTFMNNYAVMAPSQEMLQHFIDDASLPKLSAGETYRKVANNLPVNGAIFVYADLDQYWEQLEVSPTAMSIMPSSQWKMLKPFFQLFKAAGISMRIEKGRIITQIFTHIDKQKIDAKGFIEYPTKYQGNLLALANEGTLFFTGGHDVARELSRLETIFQGGTNASPFTFEGILEAQKERFFGKDINIKEDIYPLLLGEYLLTMEGTLQKPVINFFLKLDPENRNRFETLLTAFIKAGGIFSPEVKEVTLPDGTKGREVVAVGQIIRRSDEMYENNVLTTLQIGDAGTSAYLAIVNDTAIISTDQNSIKKIIDRAEGKITQNLTTDQSFSQNLQLVMKTADEIIALKPESLWSFLPQPEIVTPYLQPFMSVMVGKNFFEDGISEIYLITLK